MGVRVFGDERDGPGIRPTCLDLWDGLGTRVSQWPPCDSAISRSSTWTKSWVGRFRIDSIRSGPS